jgi:multidrug efflux pump subunit AcrA (membrane-fusion protein)
VAQTFPGETFAGRVAVVAPTLDARTRRAAIEVAVPNGAGRLLPNMFARGAVRIGTVAGVLAVPRAAVFESATGRALYALRDGRATILQPAFGPGDGDYLAVEAGLAEGEVVAVAGLGLLADGARAVAEE